MKRVYTKAHFVTASMIVLWTLLAPITALTYPKRCNCFYYAVIMWLFNRGEIIAIPSKMWAGHHFMILVDNTELWEYTLENMQKNTPWYKLLLYKGIVRKQ